MFHKSRNITMTCEEKNMVGNEGFLVIFNFYILFWLFLMSIENPTDFIY